eukprot:CAMPEP_0171328378 /NCGR_PEP_ID=MMETSP0878-20121228/618_1 /TAXON_ID=67004 /ORGANISM="Thalassiosira weissflogii, Strain CCMP1336" /LENGTH=343 /DNA_ID=CAMNT_0011828227 /DNA_START=41 /DNA_END=1072 /DNA_ORIENTATION=+
MNAAKIALTALACTSAASALQLPPSMPSTNGMSRRSAVSSLVTSSTAALASGAASPLLVPPFIANADDVATQATSVMLNSKNKKTFPLASFGLQIYDDDTAYRLTLTALEVGYRNFFASVLAGNQKGFAKAIKASGIPRDELYICGTVLSNRANGEQAAYQKSKQGCLENMAAMAAGNIDKLDMIMLDYPGPNEESIRGQWRAFEEMLSKDKTVDDLAVSNFSPSQLDAILANPDAIKPTVNQLPFSLTYHPEGILEYNAKRNILVQSWSPLSRVLPRYGKTLESIGKKYGKSSAQVGLRWIVQNGASFTTQSKSKNHFQEDLDVFDFVLTDDEMTQLTKLAA